MGVDILSFAYAATVAAGGIMGYAKAGSIPSLGAGLIFGSILGLTFRLGCCGLIATTADATQSKRQPSKGVGAYQLSQDPSNYTVMLGTTSALGGLMGYRYYNSRKFMPAGLVFCLSVGMLTKLLVKHVGASPMPSKTI